VRLRGTLHADLRTYSGESVPETADTFLLRRVRPTFEGTFGNIYDFKFMPDFGGGRTSIGRAYIADSLQSGAVVTVGKFKAPWPRTLQSSADIRFIERALPTNLVPNRDLGLQLSGDFKSGVFAYQVGYFNGVTDGQSSDNLTPVDAETDTAGDYAARVFFQPFINSENFSLRGLGFGVGATWIDVVARPRIPRCPRIARPVSRASSATGQTPRPASRLTMRRLPMDSACGSRAALLLARAIRRARGMDAGRAGRLAHRRSRHSHRFPDALGLADAVLLVPHRRRGNLPRLHAGQHLPPGKDGSGAWELVAATTNSTSTMTRSPVGATSFANPLTAVSKTTAYGVGVNWYPVEHGEAVAQLRAELVRRRRRDRRSCRREGPAVALRHQLLKHLEIWT